MPVDDLSDNSPEARTLKPNRLRRVPLAVHFAILILPTILVGTWCRRMMPGEVWRPSEVILRAAGFPVALVLACASFRGSSAWRRVGLIIVIGIAVAGIAGMVEQLAEHWWAGAGKNPYE